MLQVKYLLFNALIFPLPASISAKLRLLWDLAHASVVIRKGKHRNIINMMLKAGIAL